MLPLHFDIIQYKYTKCLKGIMEKIERDDFDDDDEYDGPTMEDILGGDDEDDDDPYYK